jgi:hypothetical protein
VPVLHRDECGHRAAQQQRDLDGTVQGIQSEECQGATDENGEEDEGHEGVYK